MQATSYHDLERFVEYQRAIGSRRSVDVERYDAAPERRIAWPVYRHARNLGRSGQKLRDECLFVRPHRLDAAVAEKAHTRGQSRDTGHVQRPTFVRVRQEVGMDLPRRI